MSELFLQACEFTAQNPIEFTAVIFSLIYVVLSLKQHISMWIFGFISAALYVYVFFAAKFYADASLQTYYVFISIYAWFKWGKQPDKPALSVSHVSIKQMLYLTVISGLIFLFYAYILHQTDTSVPYADAATTALGITATWMLTQKKIEHWLIWIAVDFFSVALYYYKDLYFTAFLYLIYAILAVLGYLKWKKDLPADMSF